MLAGSCVLSVHMCMYLSAVDNQIRDFTMLLLPFARIKPFTMQSKLTAFGFLQRKVLAEV